MICNETNLRTIYLVVPARRSLVMFRPAPRGTGRNPLAGFYTRGVYFQLVNSVN